MTRRDLLEKLVGAYCRPRPWQLPANEEALRIFVLRNNDIGDLILATPLFAAIKRLYPKCSLQVGIGDWNRPILEGDPNVDAIIPCNAPWHNKVSCKHSPNSPIGFLRSLMYIFSYSEVQRLRQQGCSLGIDVLGSLEGTLLLRRGGIPNRMGARGYGGGHSGCQKWRQFQIDENAGRSTLRYAELLGMAETDLPENKPKLHLTQAELEVGSRHWKARPYSQKIVISTGAGFPEKCWPVENFKQLAARLTKRDHTDLLFLGAKKDAPEGDELARSAPGLRNLAGQTTLRETLAIVANADFVVCNTTMFMHVAAAFEIPTLVLLGPWYDSAQLHRDQWGHPNCTIRGREVSQNQHGLATVEEAFDHCSNLLDERIPNR